VKGDSGKSKIAAKKAQGNAKETANAHELALRQRSIALQAKENLAPSRRRPISTFSYVGRGRKDAKEKQTNRR